MEHNVLQLIPAIDLYNGRCVRLYKGSYDSATVVDDDPIARAQQFAAAGAQRLHIVDLGAARGETNNRAIIQQIRQSVACEVEVGGGVRTEADVEELLEYGIDFIVIGTLFAKQPHILAQWSEQYGKRFIVGIDALDGEVRIAGWEENSGTSDLELARTAYTYGAVAIIYTSIARDGTMTGPDIEATNAVADSAKLPVILSGGMSSMDDIQRVIGVRSPWVQGIILGKSLYSGAIDYQQALVLVSNGTL